MNTDQPGDLSRESPRRFRRSVDGRLLGGVARGLALHLGVSVVVTRVAFVVLVFANGVGAIAYAAFWAFAPLGVERPGDPSGVGRRARRDRSRLLWLLVLVLGAAFGAARLGAIARVNVILPLAAVACGVAIVWREADDAQRARWLSLTGVVRPPGDGPRWLRSRWFEVAQLALGVVTALGGITALIRTRTPSVIGQVLLAAFALLVGVAIIAGPYLLRTVRELSAERRERVRSQERAEMAALMHDSVLHTLTLIQRHVGDRAMVTKLARAQERELRDWLYRSGGSSRPGDPVADAETFASALRSVAAGVEDVHVTTIEVICVGDCPCDERVSGLLHATREAMVNAAKYAGTPVSVYAEVEAGVINTFVRDRGPGFDLDGIPEDRMGIRESIVGRMARHGGTATVSSTPGDGTEIQLTLPRAR